MFLRRQFAANSYRSDDCPAGTVICASAPCCPASAAHTSPPRVSRLNDCLYIHRLTAHASQHDLPAGGLLSFTLKIAMNLPSGRWGVGHVRHELMRLRIVIADIVAPRYVPTPPGPSSGVDKEGYRCGREGQAGLRRGADMEITDMNGATPLH